jgi:murein DD-endopeptidase MepM/ murein hydrolase activator NlpD
MLSDYIERLANIAGEGTRETDFRVMTSQRAKAKQDFIKNLQLQKQRNLEFAAFAPPGSNQQQSPVAGLPPGKFSGKLSMYPLKGDYRISSNYGPRKHPVHGKASNHTGVDWAASQGTPIYAPGDGTISAARFNKIYGNQTILDLGGGYSTMFGHQSKFNVKPGQRVRAGDLIGYVGSTGWSTGPHLHFETWFNNKPVNPLSWFS